MAIPEEHEEHANTERWLVSYADFVTLLFAFFVVMYAISIVDQKRMIDLAQSVKWALSLHGKGGGERILATDPEPPPRPAKREAQKAGAEEVANNLKRRLARASQSAARPSVLVFAEGTSLVVRISVAGLFEAGSNVLEPGALATLDEVLAQVGGLKRAVRVEGHTDSEGSATPFDTNWALSAGRAAVVATYAQAIGAIPATALSVAAFGSRRPVAPNDTPEGRAKNRRIELVVMMVGGDDDITPGSLQE